MSNCKLQTANVKVTARRELEDRLLRFAAACLKLVGRLSRTIEGRYIAGQLMRSSASAGANYHEACAAESRADFCHKLQVALKELRESEYRLRLLRQAALIPESATVTLQDESGQLVRIIARSVITAKSRVQ
jgi:four helix bundle protein